ncbi:hypothetical protein B0H11DRAFT_2430528 [Mycena galericulata]|nr:hypothetical protein B0H11DRAFT_2430528 [Mycena galericulata]
MELEEPAFRLYLAPELGDLHLDVPISVVSSLCLYPVKYLRYLGYCILGVTGTITWSLDGEEIQEIPDEDPVDAGVYYFVRESHDEIDEDILAHAVDPEAPTYSHAPETTNTGDNFRTTVSERDVSCIFTNTAITMCQGIHIVPFSKGDTWLKQIIESRIAEDDEDVTNFTSINEIRNGMLVANTIHTMIDQKNLVVLKVFPLVGSVVSSYSLPIRPRIVFSIQRIFLHSNNNPDLFGDVEYSTNLRYTLQWLQGDEQERRSVPNNMEAAFKKHSKKAKPSPLLLNYNYGVAVLKWWGQGKERLVTARTRPAGPIAAPLESPRSKHDRAVTTGELDGSGDDTEAVDIDVLRQSQAEELVLTFWANTPAARTRRARQRAERRERMAEWQNGVRMALKS